MASIQFDGTEIQDTTHRPQFIKHETTAERTLATFSVAREDGDVLVTERYGKKVIVLQGTLTAASQDLLDEAIDNFKELLSRPERDLDISWAGGTLRYVATCSRHEFDRDHYHLSVVPWRAEFVVASGMGKATAATQSLNEEEITTDDADEEGIFIAESSFDLEGSKAPQPVITLEIVNADAEMKGFEYRHETTGERILVTRDTDWSAAVGKQIIIDCENKKVTDNLETAQQVEGNFLGLFPRFAVGSNNVRILTGGIINQRSSDDSIPSAAPSVGFSNTNIRFAVSFQVPYADETFGGLILGLAKQGTPGGNLFAQIRVDDGGEPDMSSTIANWTIDPSDVLGYPDFTYVQAWAGDSFALQANTRYWLVVGAQAGSGSDRFHWHASNDLTYPRGSSLLSADAGSSWSTDANIPSFRILIGGLSAETELKHTVAYTKTYL